MMELKTFFEVPKSPARNKGNCLPNNVPLTIGCTFYNIFMSCPVAKQTKKLLKTTECPSRWVIPSTFSKRWSKMKQSTMKAT